MKLLVYGTLLKGHYNHRLLKDSKFLYKYQIPGYTLYTTGAYPVAIRTEKESQYITGEVYEIDHLTWGVVENMERYAGYKSVMYKGITFFEYKDWLKATTRFEHIGSTWS